MFLSKAGAIGKTLCDTYKKDHGVRFFLARLNDGQYKITYYFRKDEESLVYEAFNDKGEYIFLEVLGNGKPVEHRELYSAIPGLDEEQKALYVYLFEYENSLFEKDKNKLESLYSQVASQMKSIMPLTNIQIEKRIKIRREFLKYITAETVGVPREESCVSSGKMRIEPEVITIPKSNMFGVVLSLIDEDGSSCHIDDEEEFLKMLDCGSMLVLGERVIESLSTELFDSLSLDILKLVRDVIKKRHGHGPLFMSTDQFLRLFSLMKGHYLNLDYETYYIDSEIHSAGYKVLPDEELEFVPSLFIAKAYKRYSNQEHIALIDQQSNVIELYEFPHPSIGKVFNFFLENEDADYQSIKDIIFEKTPSVFSLDPSNSKKENNLKISLYIDNDSEGCISFKTEYTVFGEHKEKDDLKDNYYYQTIIKNYKNELDKIGALENGLLEGYSQIYHFLFQDFTSLRRVADVMISDRLSGYKTVHIRNLSLQVKNNIDWLSVSIKSPDFDENEIALILQAYKRKRKFVLLRDNYVILEDEYIKKFFDTVSGSVKLNNSLEAERKPIYEAFKLLSLKDEGIKLEFTDFVKNVIEDIAKYKEKEISLTDEVKKVIRPYQQDGIKWLSVLHEHCFGGILADDMGLGKTLETVSFLASTKERKPSLIVAPKSVIYNWQSEFKLWAPNLKVEVVDGSKKERISKVRTFNNKKKTVFITSYDSIRNDIDLYKKKKFSSIILDEAQYIKNGSAMKSRAVRELKSFSKFALTGTPIENSMWDLWAIFDFLMPGYLDSKNVFKQRYILAGDQNIARTSLSRKIAPFLLRRTKKEVLKDLPKKTTQTIKITMNDEARAYYDACLIDAKLKMKQYRESPIKTGKQPANHIFSVLPLLTKLREVCVDPSMFLDGFVEKSSKIEYAISYILTLLQEGHKVLVFSSFTKVLDHMLQLLKDKKINSYYIYGGVNADDRLRMANDFNSNDKVNVMLVSLKAGGTGLNLHGADVVIHLDPWWNVAAEDQATDRAYRIGQKRPVSVIKLVCHDSIEEKVIQLQETKRELYDQIIKSGDEAISKLSFDDIEFLLG